MVDAAHRQLPGISNRMRVRHALEAAAALIPDPETAVDLPVTARIHLQIDQAQLHAETVAAFERWRAGYLTDEQGRMVLATYDAAIPTDGPPADGWAPRYVPPTFGPLTEEEKRQLAEPYPDTPMQFLANTPQIIIHEPRVLAGVSEIAARLQVGRSTVAGWVKNAEANGMPAPLATLAAGPVYDLEAVEAWHAAWKAG